MDELGNIQLRDLLGLTQTNISMYIERYLQKPPPGRGRSHSISRREAVQLLVAREVVKTGFPLERDEIALVLGHLAKHLPGVERMAGLPVIEGIWLHITLSADEQDDPGTVCRVYLETLFQVSSAELLERAIQAQHGDLREPLEFIIWRKHRQLEMQSDYGEHTMTLKLQIDTMIRKVWEISIP